MLYVIFGVLVGGGALLFAARQWAARTGDRRPARGKYPVRERQIGRGAGDGERRIERGRPVHVDVPAARSRATELANRRAIRWKDPT